MPFKSALRFTALATASAALAVGGAAQAHAHLEASFPAARAIGPAPSQIKLSMSEALMAKFSGVELTTGAGATVVLKPLQASDRKTLLVAPTTPLKPGTYVVKWHAVASDMHRSQGKFSFTVR